MAQELAAQLPPPAQGVGINLPYMQEQSTSLAQTIVSDSLNTIPQEIFDYFWHGLGLDLIVNNFNERDLALLELKLFQTILNSLGYVPLRDLRKPVKIKLPVNASKAEKQVCEDGTELYVESEGKRQYVEYVLENVRWDELIDNLIFRAMIMAKRSRYGFTMEKLTSFTNTQGYALNAPQPEKRHMRWF